MASFRTLARRLDEKMGRVFELIDKHGMTDNTLVICTTDHGIAFPRMKCNLYDTGIGVMLMMRWPNGDAHGFRAGRVVDSLVSHVDVFPTLCDVLGIDPPQWLEGKSLMPVLRDEKPEVNDEIFAEVTFHAAYEPQRCVRTNRWKYIRRYTESEKPVLPNCDDSPSKTLWMEHGWKDRPVAREQLYDLMFDPHEANNVAADPNHAAVLDEMRERLDRWMERTNDPLRKGWIDPPKGARLNDPKGISPTEPPFVAE
jgi:arylsulfatase A-like enzyme